jgi:hypothetical protein
MAVCSLLRKCIERALWSVRSTIICSGREETKETERLQPVGCLEASGYRKQGRGWLKIIGLIDILMAGLPLTFPISASLVAAMKDLADQVRFTQPATSLLESNRYLQGVKQELSLFSGLIVRLTQMSKACGLSPQDISKLVLKVHQTVLEVTEDYHSRNNVIEAHGLLGIIGIPPPARTSLPTSDLEVEVAADIEPRASGKKLYLPLSLVRLT